MPTHGKGALIAQKNQRETPHALYGFTGLAGARLKVSECLNVDMGIGPLCPGPWTLNCGRKSGPVTHPVYNSVAGTADSSCM